MLRFTLHTTGMHNDDATSPLPEPEEYESDAPKADAEPVVRRLPIELNNWQVWDIDGSSTETGEGDGDVYTPHIPDLQDNVLIATLPDRRWQVEPGNAVTLSLTVLNNSGRRLAVRAYLEGWLDDRWVAEPYVQAGIAPGERRPLVLTVAPPRHSGAEAGDYHLAVVVRSPDEPTRIARLGIVLSVLPFDRVIFDPAEFSDMPATWWRRTLLLPLRVTNEGNRPLTLRLNGATASRLGRFAFPGDENGKTLVLDPGQRERVPVRLTVRRLPLMALHSRSLPFVLRATTEDGRVIQQLRSTVDVHPIVGAWQIASLFGLAMAGAVATMLILVLGALFLRIGSSEAHVPAPAEPPAPSIIVVTLNQPVAMPDAASGAARTTPSDAASAAPQGQPDPSLPLVLPDQVTAPGSGGPVRSVAQPATAPLVTAPGAAQADMAMTYAQMFQTVGAQYDLDWRMLAAQAYVESGFDTLALSSAGAMGLMQVLPGTWREWAPAVNASDPFDSYSSVQVAAVYLDYLRSQLTQRGYPEKEWMLVAYHWGFDRLNGFLTDGGGWQELPEARRRYAEEILRIARTLP